MTSSASSGTIGACSLRLLKLFAAGFILCVVLVFLVSRSNYLQLSGSERWSTVSQAKLSSGRNWKNILQHLMLNATPEEDAVSKMGAGDEVRITNGPSGIQSSKVGHPTGDPAVKTKQLPEVTCKFPRLDPWDKTIKKYIGKETAFGCKVTQPYLSSLDANGNIKLNMSEVDRLNETATLSCSWRTVDRSKGKDDNALSFGNPINIDADDQHSFPTVDTAEIRCWLNTSLVYYNLHNYPMRLERAEFRRTDMNHLSVFLFALDSTSLSMFRRNLPITYEYLTKKLGLLVFDGYTKVGDNTFPNMVAILMGKRPYDQQPDMPVDISTPKSNQFDSWDLIWKRFAVSGGYATSFVEDVPQWGLFHYLARGFAAKPVNHYLHPFFYLREYSDYKKKSTRFCCGNEPCYAGQLRAIKNVLHHYQGTRQFLYGFFTELTHDYGNELGRADSLFAEFFQEIHNAGYLNNTMMMVMSDHGHRFAGIRGTLVGLLEERMPIFGLYFPPWFYARNPELFSALQLNTQRLTSPFDVYETMQDVLNVNLWGRQRPIAGSRGLSLLYEISPDRNCSQAGIPDHYCVCTQARPTKLDNPIVIKSAQFIMNHINDKLLKPVASQCEKLTLGRILRAEIFEPNQKVVQGIKSFTDAQKLTASPGKAVVSTVMIIRVLIEATESKAQFETAVNYNTVSKNVSVVNDINRTNKYGDQSICIKDPRLRLYCLCKKSKR